MVLWEITLATAYWLGIRKTYRLALKLERRLISPKLPRVRNFMHRHTRNVFDIALRAHKEIQSRDLSAGKSLGNFILRLLDRARPAAKIRPHDCETAGQKRLSAAGSSSGDKVSTTRHLQEMKSSKSTMGPDKLLFTQYVNRFPFAQTISNRFSVGIGRRCPGMQETKSVSGHRPCTTAGLAWETAGSPFPTSWLDSSFRKGVFRNDIAQWMGKKAVRNSTAF